MISLDESVMISENAFVCFVPRIFSRTAQLQSPMSSVSVPVSLPVKITAQDSNITFTQTEEGYFMNFAVKVEVPLKDLVDSLMQCGETIPGEIASLSQQAGLSPATTCPETEVSPLKTSGLASRAGLSDESATCDRIVQTPSYCSVPFPRIDSPYKSRGRWRSNSATFFMRERGSSKKQLSPNAPVFTPCYMQQAHPPPVSSPFSQCSLAGSDTVWDLPGLPSPVIEANTDPVFASFETPPPIMAQSILQRGISNQCRQM
jgi:hypothetical protein